MIGMNDLSCHSIELSRCKFHCLEISQNRYNIFPKTGQVSHLDAIVNVAFVFHNVVIGVVRH